MESFTKNIYNNLELLMGLTIIKYSTESMRSKKKMKQKFFSKLSTSG